MKSKQIGRDRTSDSDFAKLLEENLEKTGAIRPGEPVSVKVTNNKDREYVFVASEFGPGVIPRVELLDEEGRITVNDGERITVFYNDTVSGEKRFTTVPQGRVRNAILNTAMRDGIPIMGKIAQKIKGGYEVSLGDVIAFCPASHIDNEEASRPRLEFMIIEIQGRRVIASRKAFRERLRAEQREILQGELQEGDIVTGNVSSLQDFGAFVDIGGVEGLIPISELAFTRIGHPREVLNMGQSVRTQVLNIDWAEDKITLSLRALMENPWQGKLPFEEGEIVEGVVESIKTFGIFVRLPDSFTGLIPMSESGVPRGARADEYYHRGQELRVMVLRIDRDRERISLSTTRVEEADTRAEYEQYMQQEPEEESGDDGVSSFGKLLKESLEQSSKN